MTLRRTAAALVIGTLLTVPSAATVAAASPAAPAALGIRLTEMPASEQDDPRARLYVIDHVAPGTTLTRQVEISNTGDQVLAVSLYAAAAAIHEGSFLGAPGRTADAVSSWTTVSPGRVDVPAGSVVAASISIAVPADAAPGEHYAVVWAETGGGGTAAGVSVVNRVGIRVYLSVGPGGSPEAAFSIDSMTAERDADGLPVVAARVHNTGGRALDLSGTLELSNGPASLSAGPFPAALGTTLAPGDTETVRFALDARLPSGPWDAVITLHSGEVEEIASATISFPVAGTSPAVSTTGPAGPARWPWLVLAVLVVIVVIVVIVARRRGRPTDPRMTGRTPHSGRSTGAHELRTR